MSFYFRKERKIQMKQNKKLIRKEKELLSSKRLNPQNWLVNQRYSDHVIFLHKQSGKLREIKL
jgi:hypothetical protein